MNKHLFTVYDSAAGMYLDPFVAPSIEFAIREFRKLVNQQGHQFNNFPEDYTLFHIGEYNPMNALLEGIGPTSLGVAITFVEQVKIPFSSEESNG